MNNKKIENQYLLFQIVLSFAIFFCIGLFLDLTFSNIFSNTPSNFISVVSVLISLVITIFYLHKTFPIIIKTIVKKANTNFLWIGVLVGFILLLINYPFKSAIRKVTVDKFLVDPSEGYVLVLSFLILVGIIIPIAEEFYYRGFIYILVKNKYSPLMGYFVSSGLFYIGHNFSISALICGLLLCYTIEKSGTIFSCIVAHMLWNLGWFGSKYVLLLS